MRRSVVPVILALSGCGSGVGLPIIPDDCIVFSREEARDWYANVLERRNDGASELEAFGAVLAECVAGNCDGQSAGACAVSCASCADALASLGYE